MGSGADSDYMFAGDLGGCIRRAITKFASLPEIMNVGIGEDCTVNDYYRAVAEVVGYEGSFTHDLTKPSGMARKLVDTSRMRAWGWKPVVPLKDGIAASYEFFKANSAGNK